MTMPGSDRDLVMEALRGLDPALEENDLLRREGTAYAHGTVPPKRLDETRLDRRAQSASSIRSQ